MINTLLLEKKMSDIRSYLDEMSPILEANTSEIKSDTLQLRSLERLFQLIVDSAIDINTHIISERDFAPPDDYQSSFRILAENKVIPVDFALRIAPSVGLRNLVVHRYGTVDVGRMIDDIKTEIGQYKEYLQYIDTFLKTSA